MLRNIKLHLIFYLGAFHIQLCRPREESSLIIEGTKLIFYKDSVDYTAANATCTMLNGNLVNVKTSTTQQAIREKVLELRKTDVSYGIQQGVGYKVWSGGYRDNEGSWRWSDGVPIPLPEGNGNSFQKWGPDDPNVPRGTPAFLSLVFKNQNSVDDIWYDNEGSYRFAFICEKDINECDASNNCSANANCHNTDGSYTCSCKDGYSGNGWSCEDINECDTSNNCSANANCHNTDGSYTCSCRDGYSGNGSSCEDINECDTSNNCSANANCYNTDGSYTCFCRDGYSGNGSSCEDINECDTSNNCSANANCHNTNGSYSCSCKDGYSGDGLSCEDINECDSSNNCSTNADCHNTDGNYSCSCQTGYIGDGFLCKGYAFASIRCERLVINSNEEVADLNQSSLITAECGVNPFNNLSKEVQVSYFENQLSRVHSSNASFVDVFDSITFLINSTEQQDKQISNEVAKAVLLVVAAIVENRENNSLPFGIDQSQVIVRSLSTLTRLVEVTDNTTLKVETNEFVVKASMFSGDMVPMKPRVFTPNYTNEHGEDVQPVRLTLPTEAFQTSREDVGQGGSEITERRSSFILYKNSKLFPTEDNFSIVVSAEIGRSGLSKKLNQPVSIQFLDTGTRYGKHKLPNNSEQVRKTRLRCVFWDFNTTSWSDEGCFLNLTSNPPECLCNHLTNFALIVTSEYTLSDVALEYTSIVGSSLSIVALFLTIVVNLWSKKTRQRRPTKIILNVCCNLLLVYVIFLAGVSKTNDKIGCDVVAILLHYFLLTSWCWMAVYSYDIYVMITKVLLQGQAVALKLLSIFAYGFPALIVSITAGITLGYVDKGQPNHLYNSESDPLLESSYRAGFACWLRNYSLYFGFLLPVGMMLLFNVIAFILILRKMNCTKNDMQLNASGKRTTKMTLPIALTMTSMMGITWLLGYFVLLSRIPLYVTITSWLFAIFNSLQGVLIFLLNVIRIPELLNILMTPLNTMMQKNGRKRSSNPFGTELASITAKNSFDSV